MPTSRPRISVTKDPQLVEALDRGRALLGAGAPEATLVHDLAVEAARLLGDEHARRQFAELERVLDDMREAPIDRSVTRSAVGAMRELVSVALHHRVPITDALIAAAATARGVGVLHYDEHFDRLAMVLGFDSRWIVPGGSA